MFSIALEIFVFVLAVCLSVKWFLAQVPYCCVFLSLYDYLLNCVFVSKCLYCDTLVKMCTENKPQLEMHVKYCKTDSFIQINDDWYDLPQAS